MTSAKKSFEALRSALCEEDSDHRLQTVRNLIEAGTDVNSCDPCGFSVLMAAAGSGFGECVRVLLEAGADVNHSDKDGKTALMVAQLAFLGPVECVQLLLEAGADVNQSNNDGYTALMVAVWYGQFKRAEFESEIINAHTTNACLRLLINAGADIAMQNNMHLQPIHFALRMWPYFKFPAEYLISENCNLSQASYDKVMTSVNRRYFMEEDRLDIVKFLFACGLPHHLCQSFIFKQEMSVRNWMESVAYQPNTLKSICVFEIRRNLGLGIKSKVSKLKLPNLIQNLILLKGILSLECFS